MPPSIHCSEDVRVAGQELGHRSTYLDALDPEGDFSAGPAIAAITEEFGRYGDSEAADLNSLVSNAMEWSASAVDSYRADFPAPVADSIVEAALLNCAPLGVMAGAWLQWLSCAANADTELCLRVLTVYADDLGAGRPSADRGSSYLALMRRLRAAEGAYTASQLPGNERIADVSFRFPGRLLLASRRPDLFTPELLGADLCLRAVGTLPPLSLVDRQSLDEHARRDLDLGAARTSGVPSSLARSLETAELLTRTDGPRRLLAGFRWALAELGDWNERLFDELDLARNPAYDMWQLICSRASQAAIYHNDFQLEDRPLSEWFRDIGEGPEPFLRSLAASRVVRPDNPDRSPLVRGLIGFRGPMFRVFTDADVEVIRRWIRSLPGEESSTEDTTEYYRQLRAAQRKWHRRVEHAPSTKQPERPTVPARPMSLPEAYHSLLTRPESPPLRRFARDYVRGWLARSRYRMDNYPDALPPRWDRAEGLRPWLDEQHRKRGGEFATGADDPLPSRESLIDSTIQTAPLTLIDGGWIQGFTDYHHASSITGHFLFQTYWDELGNGELELNHPLIYRDLLTQMGVDLPPTRSREFAYWPGFREESFRLPVYWLCVSRFPRTFMPEILGLNLAMEMSGVGGGYRKMSRALKKYGFSTLFVDLHNTIDNVSTGHSAWAVDAVDSYLAGLSEVMGTEREPVVWDRIRVGYRSLTPSQGLLASCYARTIGKRMVSRDV